MGIALDILPFFGLSVLHILKHLDRVGLILISTDHGRFTFLLEVTAFPLHYILHDGQRLKQLSFTFGLPMSDDLALVVGRRNHLEVQFPPINVNLVLRGE